MLTQGGCQYFNKNRTCVVEQCGYKHFFINDKGDFIELVTDCEWCSIEILLNPTDGDFKDFEDKGYGFTGIIRAKDLKPFEYINK